MQPVPRPPFLTAHTRRRVVGVALLLMAAAGSGAARADSATGVFVQTTALRLQDDQASPIDPRKRRVRFKSSTKKDAPPNRVVAPAPGSAGDPTTMGGVVVVQSASGTGEAARVDLPPTGWTVLGSPTRPKGYVFRDGAPGAAISKVVVKDDSLVVRGGGAAWSYTLDEPQQGRIAVRLELGSTFWCTEAPAQASGRPPTTARNDKPGKFVAAPKTLAPAACAIVPPVPPGEDFAVRWAHTLSGPTNEDEIDGVAAAPDGSAFVTGKFEQTATLAGVTLTSAGRADIPLARFSPSGVAQWVNRYGGPGEDNLFDIDADVNGAVGTGWFEGTVDFGSVRAVSAGASDCVIVAVANDGSTRWVRTLGGPFRDGCNEVSLAADGSIVTSMDTEGGWTPPGLDPIPLLNVSDTLLIRLAADGQVLWMQRVGGDGPQRGKSLAVAPDGSVAFGGDSIGPLTAGGTTWTVPGAGRDAWMSRWSSTGTLQWLKTWGGPGDDLAKGLAATSESVFAVGPFTGTIDVAGVVLNAGAADDLLVARFAPNGALEWATSVTAADVLGGVEIVTAPDGGVLFGSWRATGIQFRQATGAPVPLDERHGGIGWLAHYRPDGSVGFATTIEGTASGLPGEIARTGQRVYLDVTLRGTQNTVNGMPLPAQGKDSSVWALDLATEGPVLMALPKGLFRKKVREPAHLLSRLPEGRCDGGDGSRLVGRGRNRPAGAREAPAERWHLSSPSRLQEGTCR